jgi:predicted Holliday junction resolvase-like endonuclease
MSLLDDLKRSRQLFAACPNCAEEFPLAKANLFDATKPFPPKALAHLTAEKQALRDDRADLKRQELQAAKKPAIGATSSITGKVLEKIAPSLPGFPVSPGDCRALFEPIDYVVFKGLSAKGKVDCLIFVDVKSGDASLGKLQKQIRHLVASNKVKLKITPRAKEIL